jgi:hypothetical protein
MRTERGGFSDFHQLCDLGAPGMFWNSTFSGKGDSVSLGDHMQDSNSRKQLTKGPLCDPMKSFTLDLLRPEILTQARS